MFVCVLSWSVHRAHAGPAPVVNGTSVPEGKWRDVVLVVGRQGLCTGTLIAPDVVLTAGHCIDIDLVEVRTDTVDYSTVSGDRIPIKWARAYPHWEDRYDVGVIVLEHVARGRPRAIAATCHEREGIVEGATLHVVGFGVTSENDQANTEMREADVTVIDPTCTTDHQCQESIAPHGELIAGGRSDACFGDSGGPLYLDTPGGPALVGVVSRGLAVGPACGRATIYVRADKVVSWVRSVTGVQLERSSCDAPGPADGEHGDGEREVSMGGCSSTRGWGGVGLCLAVVIAIAGMWRANKRWQRWARRKHAVRRSSRAQRS